LARQKVTQARFINTESPENQFVYFTENITIDGQRVRANEVAILESVSGEFANVHIVRLEKKATVPAAFVVRFNPAEVGDAYPKKVCNVCQRYLDTTLFEFNQNRRNNIRVRRPSCRDCRIIIDGVPSNPVEKRRWERSKPNLVPFKCPICEKTTIPGLTSKIVLDHNHNTGEIRGWICDSCNTGIGRFKDDIGLLKKAIRYLENPGRD
jgi:hypothetical protein